MYNTKTILFAIILMLTIELFVQKGYAINLIENSKQNKGLIFNNSKTDSIVKRKQYRWEIGVNGGVNFQRLRHFNLIDWRFNIQRYPLNTMHFEIELAKNINTKFSLKSNLAFDQFGYKEEIRDPQNLQRLIWKDTYIYNYINIGLQGSYRIKCSSKLFFNLLLGSKIGFMPNEVVTYSNYIDRQIPQEQFVTKMPFKLNSHFIQGITLYYKFINRLGVSFNIMNSQQLGEFKQLDTYPGAGRQFITLFQDNYTTFTSGITYLF